MSSMAPTAETLASLEDLRRIHADARAIVRHTPVFSLKSVAERCGGDVAIKAENLQRTGSFKLRGALSKLATLDGGTPGVVAGSAGNHAQALAYAARARGLPCLVHMPTAAAISKVAAVEAFGAQVLQGGDSVDECVERARARLAAGILLDATVIRALIVPAVIALMGRWNWWLPAWPARILRVAPSRLAPPRSAHEHARA